MKRLLYYFIAASFSTFLIILYCNHRVISSTRFSTYSEIDEIPYKEVALVLGTSKRLANGMTNLYFKYRIDAVTELYQQNKISYIIVSGDHGRENYNEPEDMKEALLANGVPDEIIHLDYAGFRTLDSVIRMKEIFGFKDFIIVSQKFHNQRAVFIAQKNGLNVIGYNANDVNINYGFKTNLREYFAKVKVFIDVIIDKQPKFLGEPIDIKKAP